MAIPNLISILVLAPVIKEETLAFQRAIRREKAVKAAALSKEETMEHV